MGQKRKPKPKVATPLGDQIRETIRSLMVVKARLPPILDLVEELKRVARGENVKVRNDIVLQMARDSFDMLVIDLASLREQMVSNEGILNQLRHHAARFVSRPPGSFPSSQVTWVGEPNANAEGLLDTYVQELRADNHAAALKRLFPKGPPVADADIDELISGFIKETKAVDDDRNKVRAHRFEAAPNLAKKFYLVPNQVAAQIELFERYLNDLFLVVEDSTHAMNVVHYGNRKDATQGLADLIVWGGINRACIKYGVTPERVTRSSGADPCPWYWAIWGRLNRACIKYGVTQERVTGSPGADPRPWYWAKREDYLSKQVAVDDDAGSSEPDA